MTEILVVVLTLCAAGPSSGSSGPCHELRAYDSREECRITAQSIRIGAPGGRLFCRPREPSLAQEAAR